MLGPEGTKHQQEKLEMPRRRSSLAQRLQHRLNAKPTYVEIAESSN